MVRAALGWLIDSGSVDADWVALEDGVLVARRAGILRRSIPSSTAFRFWVDVRPAIGNSPMSLVVNTSPACRVSLSGDETDDALVQLAASQDASQSPRVELAYRLRPDVSRWTSSADLLERLRVEFSALPGWRRRSFRLALDVTPCEVRAWVDGRFVSAWPSSGIRAEGIELHVHEGARVGSSGTVALPVDDAFLPLDLAAYLNDKCGPSVDEALVSLAEYDGVPFARSRTAEGLDNVDLGKTDYRGRPPYVQCSALSSDPARALLRVPRRMYDRAHLLCSADDDPSSVPSAAIRFIKSGEGHAVTSEFTVSRHGCATVPGQDVLLATVPLSPGDFHDYLANPSEPALELDLTRRVARDDDRFPRPAGPTSAVHVHAITLETAPVAMTVRSERIGHIFEMPDQPRFAVSLTSQRSTDQHVRLTAEVTDPYGERVVHERDVSLDAREERRVTLDLPQERLGTFGLVVTVAQRDGSRPLVRRTTFAVLPPDTRKAADESPFGVWCFFEGHFGVPAEVAGPLFRLSGARSTLANFIVGADREATAAKLRTLAKHKVSIGCANVAGIHTTCNAGEADVDAMLRKMHDMPLAKHWLVFWETALSREHEQDVPADLLGKSPRPLTEAEERALKNCWDAAVRYGRRVRQEFPDARLIFGNGYPRFIGAFLQRGFPADLVDGFGLDFDLFLSMPELQPCPLHCPFAGLYHLAEYQRMYGYGDKPRYLTEAIYSSQADGWLTEREQADYYVRAHLLGMASGVIHFGMVTELWDPGGEYHYSHYGPVGLCHRPPELNPRESFCAYATMTRMLDRASFDEMIPTPSPTVFCLRFRRKEGGSVHALWTIRGERTVSFAGDGSSSVRVTDQLGNDRSITPSGDTFVLTVTSSPVYVEGAERVTDVSLGPPRHDEPPFASSVLAASDALGAWQEAGGADPWLEELPKTHRGSIPAPYARGEFELSTAHGSEQGDALRVRLMPQREIHPLSVHYTVLRARKPIPVDEGFTALGARIRGNSSWGRIAFEIRDAAGGVWRSIRQYGFVDFDGWRTVVTPLPLPPTGERIEPAALEVWTTKGAQTQPMPPYRLTAIIIESRTHVIRATDLVPVPDLSFDVAHIAGLRPRT